ncbi:hypothetical protein SEA_SHAGRAT_90 [Rhodococcus phage Shagrat]|nr:hypothetical protein SEA_SHAGRAT_90 [Rhodococcus phage Shagrat]
MKREPTENAMAKEHARQERIIANSYDKHKALTSSRNPSLMHQCPNPACINSWHGKRIISNGSVCHGSWGWNDDGTPRQSGDPGTFVESYEQPPLPPNDRLSRAFGPLPRRDEEER